MSHDAYCLHLMRRALGRTDAELFGHRPRYLARQRLLAERLIGAGL